MLGTAPAGTRVQFERLGYFCADLETAPGTPVFNRTVSLKDTWAKVAAREL
jgi:glutaminyl-tRNA synthetase